MCRPGPLPTKQDPLSDRIVAGMPNLFTAYLSAATALTEVASLKSVALVTHLEASSRYVIRLRPFMREVFMACQSVCHIAFEYILSHRTHLRCLIFTAESAGGTTQTTTARYCSRWALCPTSNREVSLSTAASPTEEERTRYSIRKGTTNGG